MNELTLHQCGNLGLGAAIHYFTSKGYVVSLPITDRQRYDLVVEMDGGLKKIQVKTTRSKSKYGTWVVELKKTSIRKTGPTVLIRFDPSEVDFLFVLTGDGAWYLIPSSEIDTTCALTISEGREKFKVN